MGRHAGATVLVTGAAHGIGRAISLLLAREGAAIAIIDQNLPGAEETATMIRQEGGTAFAVKGDITDVASLSAAIDECEAALGQISTLVNNAAYSEAGDLDRISLEMWHKEIDINLNGTYHCMRLMLPLMQKRGGGVIVNIGSVNGARYFGNPAYSAAKAGLVNLTQSVASEYGRHGIRCNIVLPGSVRTDAITWRLRQEKDPQIFEKLAKWYPLGRVANPEDIAKAVSFLASDDAAYITGVALPVDGGLLAGMNVMIDEFVLED